MVELSATPKRQDGMNPIMNMQCGDISHEVKDTKEKNHILQTLKTEFEALEDSFTLMVARWLIISIETIL